MNVRVIVMSAALALSGAAWAAGQSSSEQQKSSSSQSEMRSSEQGGYSSRQETGYNKESTGEKHLTGSVVGVSGKTLFVDFRGAVVPLRITPQTKLEGMSGNVESHLKDFKEGDQIRASFDIQDRDNVASSVDRAGKAEHGKKGTTEKKGTKETPKEKTY